MILFGQIYKKNMDELVILHNDKIDGYVHACIYMHISMLDACCAVSYNGSMQIKVIKTKNRENNI